MIHLKHNLIITLLTDNAFGVSRISAHLVSRVTDCFSKNICIANILRRYSVSSQDKEQICLLSSIIKISHSRARVGQVSIYLPYKILRNPELRVFLGCDMNPVYAHLPVSTMELKGQENQNEFEPHLPAVP